MAFCDILYLPEYYKMKKKVVTFMPLLFYYVILLKILNIVFMLY